MELKEMSEVPKTQPSPNKAQKQGYSGQKKRHRIKNTVLSNQSGGNILFIGKSHPGCSHHKKMANEEIPIFPVGSLLWPDNGCQGYLPAAVIMTYQPGMKLKTEKVGQKIKSLNRPVSAIWVEAEDAIGGLKPSNIISDVYRHLRANFEDQGRPIAAG